MKHLLFASLALLLINGQANAHINMPQKTGSAKIAAAFHESDTATLSGKWELMPVLSSDTAAGKIPFIVFNIKNGRFTGNTGCNNMSGAFLLSQDALQFNEKLISTKKTCPGYNEEAFMENLLKTNRYQIEDGVLQLMYNTTVLSKWVRHADKNPTKQI
ncbi:META domain-containing protein [Parafilimonas terrae]|uniref:META domain-containing protein n=1 Tax=Parafilimonas terrae TaxID=1465490 RepID=A0A1I5SSV5_9BACT|nr:META domain-containing protein [Parafilimonas terrae]SFP73587.1 META domain-containing protein [Parafilimonas terrae]